MLKTKNNKITLFIAAAIFVVALILTGYILSTQQKPQPDETPKITKDPITIDATAHIEITETGFVPATIKVKPNTVITWTNSDNEPHHIASDPYPTNDGLEGFDSQDPLQKNDSFSFNFTKVGTYSYHDNLNPYKIKGTVIVEK